MKSALQYQATNGMPQLHKRLKALQTKVHQPPAGLDWDMLVTAGSQDGLCKAVEMILNGEPDGQSVVVEDFTYSGFLAMMDPYKPNYVVVDSDEEGMRPDKLEEAING